MPDDSCLRLNPMYSHLFETHEPAPKPEIEWLKPIQSAEVVLRNSKDGRFQVRKIGSEYSLHNIRIAPFARLLKDGFKSFDEVKEFLRRQP